MSGYETILFEKAGPAATITLNRPQARNGPPRKGQRM